MSLRPNFTVGNHKPVTLRAQDQKFFVRHDAAARTITLTWAGDLRQQTVLLDHEAFEYASVISVHRHVPLGAQTLTLTRDQAFRAARVLRSMHHPAAEAVTYQASDPRGIDAALSVLSVRVTRTQQQGRRDMWWPHSGRVILQATRAAWRSTFHGQSAEGHRAFHQRITHFTAPDRQAEASFLRQGKAHGRHFTIAEICADEHLPF
ncbi:hypothetical protein [Deinococcus aquatilis]|uniref:hypothetical protein n=1 Tax=Deinococcus aquatilis TaxID=519440 RepID=UPI000362E25A|nr:hypothetical protein [Deinococcus aquatilis]